VIREAASDQVSNKSAMVDAVQLAPLIPSMPQWLRSALFRRVAGQLGIEPPHRPRKALEGPK